MINPKYNFRQASPVSTTALIRSYPGPIFVGTGAASMSDIAGAAYSFTPTDLKNADYTVTALVFSYVLLDSTATGATRITVNGVASDSRVSTGGVSDTFIWYIPIRDYSTTLTIQIQDGSGTGDTVTYNNMETNAVITRYG